jgi:hypothetical protein
MILRSLSTFGELAAFAWDRSSVSMPPLSYSVYRFRSDIIHPRAFWMYLPVHAHPRDVEELSGRAIVVTYESVRRWVWLTFGPVYGTRLRPDAPSRMDGGTLDADVRLCVAAQTDVPLAACDAEGEVLDVLLQAKRDTRLLVSSCAAAEAAGHGAGRVGHGQEPGYGAALRELS